MGLIARKIIQSRVWIDPLAPPPPNLNYEETFPITVFDAVREDINKVDSPRLSDVLKKIWEELEAKQTIIPAKAANYIVTYAGVAGSVGSIQMTTEIPWDSTKQSNDRIPTEKAVGDLILKLGLIDEDGNLVSPDSKKVRWSDIIGRPNIYENLGINNDGFITQKGVTEAINAIRKDMELHEENSIGAVNSAIKRLDDHASNMDNPHNVTIGQIGAVSKEEFDFHLSQVNPHGITPDIIGLGNVNNTSDMDKPISVATQEALDAINRHLSEVETDLTNLRYIDEITYNQSSGILTTIYNDGSNSTLLIPIDGLVDEIRYDEETKDLVIYELSGEEKRVSLSDLYVRYTGSIGTHITVEIDGNGSTPTPESDLTNINKSEINNLWNNGIYPDGDIFTGEDNNLSEITAEETRKMWNEGILPDEIGDITGIDLSEVTKIETEDMWNSGKLPFETPDAGNIDNINSAGIKIIRAYINNHSITDNEMDDNAITTRSIKDLSVTTSKLADGAVTGIKIAKGAVTSDLIGDKGISNKNMADRSVDGRSLFSSSINNRILGVIEHGSDPVWTQVNTEMIQDNSVDNKHLKKSSVSVEKIKDNAVTESKLDVDSVSTAKIKNKSVTRDKLSMNSVGGENIIENVELRGTPTVGVRPPETSNNSSIPDTRWVNTRVRNNVNSNSNYGDRTVDGRVLFSSNTRHRVLAVLRADSDPIWTQVDNEMIAVNAVNTPNIKNNAVTSDKIKDRSIETKHLSSESVANEHLKEGVVTSSKIYKSDNPNMVLAAIDAASHPIYSKVTRDMIARYAIGELQIEDKTITPAKLAPSDDEYQVLGVGFRNTQPMWTRIFNKMIKDRAVDGRTLFSSSNQDTVLGVTVSGSDPAWLKVSSEMLKERLIKREHIEKGAIWTEHLQEKLIESRHIADWTIKQNNIAPRAITGTELFTSPYPNRVLALTTSPYANPDWLQVTTDMIEDKAIARTKMFQSDNDYRVLGATKAGVPPEYLVITNDFIEDDTIQPNKLVRDFVFYGSPQITVHPSDESNDYHIPSTKWVRSTIEYMMNNLDPDWFRIQSDMIPDHMIDGTKLFTSPYDGPRVIGVTKKGEDAEYILIEEDLIVDGAVTTNKIQRDVHLLGSPKLEIRPEPQASDNEGDGDNIPDCQWVLDRIKEAGITGSGSDSGSTPTPPTISNGSITTAKLANRSVTGPKLFTSSTANKVLAVLAPNTDPVYVNVSNEMLANRSVNGRTLFSASSNNRLLGVETAGSDPKWLKVNKYMIETGAVLNEHIAPVSITTDKIDNGAVTPEKISDIPFVSTNLLLDNSVTSRKIAEQSVDTRSIKNNNVTSDKLAPDLELKGSPTVETVPEGIKSLKNITISPNLPKDSDGVDGDIWITYI